MRIEHLRHLYEEQLIDLHTTEKQLNAAMPRLAARATARDLRATLEEQVEETKRRRTRVEELARGFEERPSDRFRGPVAMVRDLEAVVERCENPEVRDAAIIAGLQRIKHYEMAAYGCARTFAERLGEDDAAEQLEEILEEESDEDETLTRLATESINQLAAEPAAV